MIVVYKGYEKEYLDNIQATSLTMLPIDEKINIKDEKKTEQLITQSLYTTAQAIKDSDMWLTYEEFSVAYNNIINFAKLFDINIKIYKNNKYFNIYPLEVYDKEKVEQIILTQNSSIENDDSIGRIYSYIYKIDEKYFAEYYNYEYDNTEYFEIIERYNGNYDTLNEANDVDFVFAISENCNEYLSNLVICEKYKKIGIVKAIDSNITQSMTKGIVGYLKKIGIEVFKFVDINLQKERHNEYLNIARNKIGIPNFEKFKLLPFYKNPLENNEIVEISQETIINSIVEQVEASKNIDNVFYRDIFVTAPTGSGKSVMFQIPAVYAAEKFGSLTIVISPLVELMNDQVENLQERGYYRSARINSDISPFEKQEIIENIDKNNIDILYLSPEALLSYSIESIIGTRDISMVIIDEAHIVTTWGQGFRPDYWYLGSYFEKMRKARYRGGTLDNTYKIYRFPICTFTATAVYGGEDDGVLELVESLYLQDPIKYIGQVKREDISFDITINKSDLSKTEVQVKKAEALKNRIISWKKNKQKSLIYFPYNSIATQAFKRENEFSTLNECNQEFGIYTGKIGKDIRKESVIKYKNNEITTMFATKAFGMGIDIKDIVNVYHYAEAGNLNDYVQEIGRAARDKNICGMASMDYYYKDDNFGKILFGMSAIKQYHVLGCLRVLNNIFNRTQRRNNLITPQAFESVFPNCIDLENTVKTALLNIEKDFNAKYKIPVIITRPRSMFTSAYVVIDRNVEEDFLNSKFGKYFVKYKNGRNKEKELLCEVTDVGDIYKADMKSMWEELFSKMSFASFKYQFFSQPENIFGKYQKYIFNRTKIDVQMLDGDTFVGIKDKLLECINKVSKVLANFQLQQGEFTVQQLKKELNEQFENTIISENVANGYFKIIENQLLTKPFYTRKNVGELVKYKIINSTYRPMAEDLVYKSSFLKEINKIASVSTTKFKPYDKELNKKNIRILNLLSMFNIIQYDIYGGENPEIFVRINDPYRINAIVNGKMKYENQIVKRAKEKHDRDEKIFKKFVLNLHDNTERWQYIEDYFLGKDVIDDEQQQHK